MVTLIDTLQRKPSELRHPEKQNRPESAVLKKPDWLRVKAPGSGQYNATKDIVRSKGLVTVCEEAACPNIGECWSQKHATLMIMGDTCTRACAFCNVKTGLPQPLDPEEPGKVGLAVAQLGLNHVVITSVDRDDVSDGGAAHFAEVVRQIRIQAPDTTIEILTPDFLRKDGAAAVMIDAPPDVFNHNLETVPRLYKAARPGSDYQWSLTLLQRFKQMMPHIPTKSGLMLGLGETDEEVIEVMKRMREHDIDMLTLGQYLQPSRNHLPVQRFVHPDTFAWFAEEGYKMGFKNVASGPLVRSSYHADEQAKLVKSMLVSA